jgi:hypothetical protein
VRPRLIVSGDLIFFVMPGLVPGIHVLAADRKKTWMAGTSPAMTFAF